MYKGFNRHEVLKKKYKAEILSWNWNGLKEDCETSEPVTDIFGEDYPNDKIYSTFVGTVFAIMPSGKYYMPWTTNQTKHDVEKDSAFEEVLTEVAENHGMFVFNGEGDPCDLFVGYSK